MEIAGTSDPQKIAENIVDRLPGFYRARERTSFIYRFVEAFAEFLNERQKDLSKIQISRFLEKAVGQDLDLLASLTGIKRKVGEQDDVFRLRIKSTLASLKRDSTVDAIKTQLAIFLGADSTDEIALEENPRAELKYERAILSGEAWLMTSNSIFDEPAKIVISIEAGEARNPMLIDTISKVAIKFQGTLLKGERLEIANGKAFVNGVTDVTAKISFEPYDSNDSTAVKESAKGNEHTRELLEEFFRKVEISRNLEIVDEKVPSSSRPSLSTSPSSSSSDVASESAQKLESPLLAHPGPILQRKPAKWVYREKLSDAIARFDESRFDEGVFFKPIPPTKISFVWNARLLATVEVKVSQELLDKNKMTREGFESIVNSIKAAGVSALVSIKQEKAQLVEAEQKVSR